MNHLSIVVRKPPLINGVRKLLDVKNLRQVYERSRRHFAFLLTACLSPYFRDPYLKLGTVKKTYYQVNLFGEIELFVFHSPSRFFTPSSNYPCFPIFPKFLLLWEEKPLVRTRHYFNPLISRRKLFCMIKPPATVAGYKITIASALLCIVKACHK